MPKALPRSAGSLKVVVSRASTEGASRAPKAPWTVRAMTSMGKFDGRTAEGRGHGEADQADQQGPLATDDVADPTAE